MHFGYNNPNVVHSMDGLHH